MFFFFHIHCEYQQNVCPSSDGPVIGTPASFIGPSSGGDISDINILYGYNVTKIFHTDLHITTARYNYTLQTHTTTGHYTLQLHIINSHYKCMLEVYVESARFEHTLQIHITVTYYTHK